MKYIDCMKIIIFDDLIELVINFFLIKIRNNIIVKKSYCFINYKKFIKINK